MPFLSLLSNPAANMGLGGFTELAYPTFLEYQAIGAGATGPSSAPGGGGGGGGFAKGTMSWTNTLANNTQTWTVVVAPTTVPTTANVSGANSTIKGANMSLITAYGGGRGARSTTTTVTAGASGGSGGGGCSTYTGSGTYANPGSFTGTGTGIAGGTSNQGKAGGTPPNRGGGGGGGYTVYYSGVTTNGLGNMGTRDWSGAYVCFGGGGIGPTTGLSQRFTYYYWKASDDPFNSSINTSYLPSSFHTDQYDGGDATGGGGQSTKGTGTTVTYIGKGGSGKVLIRYLSSAKPLKVLSGPAPTKIYTVDDYLKRVYQTYIFSTPGTTVFTFAP
jgi:hypothetical protein